MAELRELTYELKVGEPPLKHQTKHSWIKYNSFIGLLRNELKCRSSHGRPVLADEVDPPTVWLTLVLKTDTTYISVKIRGDNLYLIGYQMANSTTWLEFKDEKSQHLIHGSTFLPFGGGYPDLVKYSQTSREKLKLNQELLITAVETLAVATDDKNRALYLTVILQMICEATRYISHSEPITKDFRTSVKVTTQMINQQNGCGKLSAALLKDDKTGKFDFNGAKMGIKGVVQAVAIIGVIKSDNNAAAVVTSTEEEVATDPGQPIVEVYSVTINNNVNGKFPGCLHGTITVEDGLGSQCIFNRKRENCESVNESGDTILLTGPTRPISAYASFNINLVLRDRDDYECSKGQISWSVNQINKVYDELQTVEVPGKYGSATVKYAVFCDAVKAAIQVKLVNSSGGESPAKVVGFITAQNSNLKIDNVLFKKALEDDDIISTRTGELILLSKSIVAAPLGSSLLVEAKLYDGNREDYEIANGTIDIPAQTSGTVEKNISGKYGEIQVKVTFTWDF